MITTVTIKEQQLKNGFFSQGSGSEKILIMGSCRVAPYVNYLVQWNELNNDRFTIYSLDPFNFNWDVNDNRTDYEQVLSLLEYDDRLLDMLRSVDIFCHEYYQNHGMFNTNKEGLKNVYQFGLSPKTDICIPSWNDLFVLVGDIVSFDIRIRKMAIQDINVIGKLSEQTLQEIYVVRDKNLEKFYEICSKTSFPEFKGMFKNGYKFVRFFWNSNHVSKAFTLQFIFFILQKIGINETPKFWNTINEYDMFSNNYTRITEYDEVKWNEEIKPLKDYLL